MTTTLDMNDAIDNAPLSYRQVAIVAVLALCLLMDGYDLQAMGYAAPALLHAWGIKAGALGPVFGAGVAGMLVGSLLLSPPGDRIGRRKVILLATLSFALCLFATRFATSVTELMVWRFLSGLGPGCILPNAMALTAEFLPRRLRVTAMMIVGCGFGLGGTLGGVLSARLIPLYGWQAVFICGAGLSLLLLVVLWLTLPESLHHLLKRQRIAEARQLFRRYIGTHGFNAESSARKAAAGRPKMLDVGALFREKRTGRTLILWLINFANLLEMYLLANWLPVLIHELGHSLSFAALSGSLLWGAGVAGNLLLGPLIDRFGFRVVLTPLFLCAMAGMMCLGYIGAADRYSLPLIAIALAGFAVIGGQPAINALSATSYPATLRATGVGWSLGIGRLGSVTGPVLGGWMLALDYSPRLLFFAAAVPVLLAALGMVAINIRRTPCSNGAPFTGAANKQS